MNIFQAAVLGIVEGLTEFLPISSTAHLIISSNLLGLRQTEYVKFFEVFIQSGAILAVVFLYFLYIIKQKDLFIKVMISFFPTAVIGFFLYKIIKLIFFESMILMIISFLGIAFVFFVLEYLIQQKKINLIKNIQSITFKDAILAGLLQSLAVVPGVSRAGIVMVLLMGRGYKREDAAKYSFLLAVPTILAASGYDLLKMRSMFSTVMDNLPTLIIGFGVSFITAYFVMKWFIGFLQKNTLLPFAVYRILLAIILMFI